MGETRQTQTHVHLGILGPPTMTLRGGAPTDQSYNKNSKRSEIWSGHEMGGEGWVVKIREGKHNPLLYYNNIIWLITTHQRDQV